MVRWGVGFLLTALVAVSTFAQSVSRVEIREGLARAAVQPAGTEPYTGGPWAAVPAKPLRSDSTLTTDSFRVRSWMEAGETRIVVFAVRRDARGIEIENQITTFLLLPGESRDVTETERYGAAHVFVSLEPAQ